MAFDEDNHITLFGEENGYVKISYSSTFTAYEEVNIGYSIDGIFGSSDEFYVLSNSNNTLYFIIATRS